jgi:PAS domain S-box-containing protein
MSGEIDWRYRMTGKAERRQTSPAHPQLSPYQDVILDSINEGVFTVDLDWRITSFNRAAEKITGIERDDAIGQPCKEVFRANICENSCAIERSLASGSPTVCSNVCIYSASGRRIPIKISAAVLRNASGKIIGGVETFQDLRQVEELRKKLFKKYSFGDIVGRSPSITQLFDLLPQIADSQSTVLIEGASGTGKELFARAIHGLSPRKNKSFIAVNCGALPDTLLESELFGYKAGAFTDARRDKPGRLAVAEGGTLLLDEIGDVSPAMQMRLLRALQERSYEPLGSVEPVRFDIRIIAATNKNLRDMVRQGQFREDLFYRLHVVHLEIPGLNQRREDIPLLIVRFIASFNHLQGKDVSGLSPNVLAVLMDHDYPGNVRELQNIIEFAFVLCHEGFIQMEHLPPYLRGESAKKKREYEDEMNLKASEKKLVELALRKHGGSRTLAAKELGVDTSTLYRKIRSMNIEVPPKDGRSLKKTP